MNVTPLMELRLGAKKRPTGKAIAKRMNIHQVRVSAIEQGAVTPSDSTLRKYALAVGQPFAEVKLRFLQTRMKWLSSQARSVKTTLERLRA